MAEGILPANAVRYQKHLVVINFHQKMYSELTYARRQILVIIQWFFGKFPDGHQQQELHWAGPDDVEGEEDFGQFLWSKEALKLDKWQASLDISLDHVKTLINKEYENIHPNQYSKLNNNQKKAKYLEMAAAGFAYLDKELINKGNLLFKEYEEACRNSPEFLASVGQDHFIQQAALGIWSSKTRHLLARVKKVVDLKYWLFRVADVFYNQPENEPNNKSLKKRLRRVLSRAYFRLYSTPDQVPFDDFVNLTWKLFGFQLDWFNTKQFNENPTFIKGRFEDLPKRRTRVTAEEVGAPPISEEAEPGEDKVPDTKHKFSLKIFNLLQDLHREIIWGRRQIMLVIQLFFGDIEQGKYEWPDEAGGQDFDVKSRENLKDSQWTDLVKLNFEKVLRLWKQKKFKPQPVGKVPLDEMPLNYQKALYVDVALKGIDHFRRLLVKAFNMFYQFQTKCQTLLNTMPEGSEEQKNKQAKLNDFLNARSKMLGKLGTTMDGGLKKLEIMATKLNVPNGQVNENDLKGILNDIYFNLHPIADNEWPMATQKFCIVAYQMFGWNWTFEVKKKKRRDKMTLFEKPDPDVRIRRYKGLKLLKRAGGAPDGSSESEEESEEEGAAGEIEDAERDEQEKRAQAQAAIGRGVQAQGGGEGASVGAQGGGGEQVGARGRGRAKGRAKPRGSESGAAGGLQ